MIANGKGNFFSAHYDWLVAGLGVLALGAAAVFYVMAIGEDPETAAQDAVAEVKGRKPSKTGVKDEDMSAFEAATKITKIPAVVTEVPEKTASFLASERRVKCKCGKAISGDVKAVPECPYCHTKQEAEKVVVLDADGDGMADEWEKRFGLNPGDPSDAAKDKDGDGFTNLEEYEAKTDPTDAKSHPDYLDSLKLTLPLKQTYLPFVFTKATKLPSGWRCEFFDQSKRKAGSTGVVSAKTGEEIRGYGYVVKSYEQKSEMRERPGMKGMKMKFDVSEVTIERKSDGKVVKFAIDPTVNDRKLKMVPVAVDVQATLQYERGAGKSLEVVAGTVIDLNGSKYKVVSVKPEGQGAAVVVEDSLSGLKRTIKAP